jgi:hypothetical protein
LCARHEHRLRGGGSDHQEVNKGSKPSKPGHFKITAAENGVRDKNYDGNPFEKGEGVDLLEKRVGMHLA